LLKRLKRLWFGDKRASDDEVLEQEALSEVADDALVAEESVDPLQVAIDGFDSLVDDIGASGAMPELRTMLLEAPADSRLLARSADLLRELDDPELAGMFDAAARTRRAAPFVALSEALQGLGDPTFGLALARAALGFEPSDPEAVVSFSAALAALGRHEEVLDVLGAQLASATADSDLEAVLAARFATSALVLGDLGRFAEVEHRLDEVAPWLLAAGARVKHFGHKRLSDPTAERRRGMFDLYGTVVLDAVPAGSRLEPERLAEWVQAVVAVIGPQGNWENPTLEVTEAIRPTWVGPKGEVLARWIAALLPDKPNPIPLTSRIPSQRILIVIADDSELAQLWEMKAFFDAPAPIFQAVKDPREINSPMADIIGVVQSDITFPFEPLEVERLAERMVPRNLAQALQGEVGVGDQASLEAFAAWVAERRGYFMCDTELEPDERPRLGAEGI